MVKASTIAKYVFLIAIVTFIIYLIYSSIDPQYYIVLLVVVFILVVLVMVIAFFKWRAVGQILPIKHKPHVENIVAEVRQSMEGNQPIDADIDDKGNLLHSPDFDISLNIGNYHFMRLKDNKLGKGNITRVFIHNTVDNVTEGELRGEVLNTRPKEAVKEVAAIIEIMETERAQRTIPRELLQQPAVQTIIQEATGNQPSNEKPGKEEKKKK